VVTLKRKWMSVDPDARPASDSDGRAIARATPEVGELGCSRLCQNPCLIWCCDDMQLADAFVRMLGR